MVPLKTEEPIPLNRFFSRYAEAPALVTTTESLSYRQLNFRIQALRDVFLKMGVSPGERVAVISHNSGEMVLILWALWATGAVAAPLSPRFPSRSLRELLDRLSCRIVVHSQSVSATLPAGQEKRFLLKDLIRQVTVERYTLSPGSTPAHLIPDQPITAILTSGSSAEPKAAVHSFANHYFSALGSNRNIPLKEGDCWLLSLPLYHVGGIAILFRTLLSGATAAVPANEMTIPEAIEGFHITHLSLVSTQLQRLLRQPRAIPLLAGLKAILLGGSAIPPALIDAAYREGLPIFTSYGSTEMASQITTTPPHADKKVLYTSGKVLPYRDIKISADGEILVRGKTLFQGYWNGSRLERPLNEEGWFATGDLGTLDAQGFLRVQGRKDNMFISGGENIQPEEIEQWLLRFPGLIQAVVVPVPDKEFGFRPAAFIETGAGTLPDLDSLREFLAKHLPRFKIPDFFFSMPSKPETKGIKISRQWLIRIAQKKRNEAL